MPSQLVVIVDDSLTNLKILERLAGTLGEGIVAKSFADPRRGAGFLRRDAARSRSCSPPRAATAKRPS